MTVEREKKTRTSKSIKPTKDTFDYTSLDTLISKIGTVETEEQVSELFEADEDLLKNSFTSLLSLMETPMEKSEFDDSFEGLSCYDKVDDAVMEIMTKFLEEELVDDEEFEDFFTEELSCEDGEEEEDDVSFSVAESDEEEEENAYASMHILNESTKEKSSIKKGSSSAKIDSIKSKNMKELEMLMEKVEDESDLDDEEYESENESDSNSEGDDEELSEKRDIFMEGKVEGEGRLSSFEKTQVSLKAEIEAIESETLQSDRPWALRGEINARQRPSDSLLEEAVDFDSLSRPTPEITEERTEEIEETIKRRIEEAAWDDVERKDGRDLTLLNGMAVNNQKSARPLLEDVATAGPHRSLTQDYEDAASTNLNNGQSPSDTASLQKQSELTGLFAKICRHIDGLSGNRFAPKIYVQSDFQIKTLGVNKNNKK